MTEQMQISVAPSLSDAALRDLPSGVKIPTYDRSKLTPGLSLIHI